MMIMRGFNIFKTSVWLTRSLVAPVAFCCGPATGAQEATLSYSSELQTGFGEKANWVNLLQLGASVGLGGGLSAQVGTISTSNTNGEHLIPDLLGFSNIEEENIPLALERLGIGLSRDGWELFLGVGNVNGAFFVTPVTSLFTNSSCGIFPTLSCNFSIANFPDASMGVEGQYSNGGITVATALYNGRGYHGFKGEDCVFRFNPGRDGIFNINAVNYSRYGNDYNMGVCLCHGPGGGNEDGAWLSPQAASPERMRTDVALWLYAEQKITGNLSVIAQYSRCPTVADGCRAFYGGGLACKAGRCDIGLYSCYADFADTYEWASELTFRYELSSILTLQPALHYVANSETRSVVGMLRLSVSI